MRVKMPSISLIESKNTTAWMIAVGQDQLILSKDYGRLGDHQLRAVIGHELGHVQRSLSAHLHVLWSLSCGGLAFGCALLTLSVSPGLAWVLAGLPALLWLAEREWIRQVEYQCDRAGARQVRPADMADALRVIVSSEEKKPDALSRGLGRLRDSHPPVAKRLARLTRMEAAGEGESEEARERRAERTEALPSLLSPAPWSAAPATPPLQPISFFDEQLRPAPKAADVAREPLLPLGPPSGEWSLEGERELWLDGLKRPEAGG